MNENYSNQVISSFDKIDEILSEGVSELKSLIDDLQFTTIAEFVLNEEIIKICDKDHDYPGIYFFEIRNNNQLTSVGQWKDEFTKLWKNQDNPMAFVPGIKKKRINFHRELTEWIPIYIGKSKYVGRRINEHLTKESHQPTFAMKLKARKNLYGKEFRVSTIRIDVNNYDIILPKIESSLRNIKNPIIGRQ